MSIYAISKLQTRVIPTSHELAQLHGFWKDSLDYAEMFYSTENSIKVGDLTHYEHDTTATSFHGEEWQDMMLKKYPEQWMAVLFCKVGWYGDDPPVDLEQAYLWVKGKGKTR